MELCRRAVRSRDARFDGWFFTAVITTGIYCRPSCPVAPPKPANMRFYPSAAAAQQRGFRACKRCRPDATAGSPEWNCRADLVARAMRLIADGVVDRDGVGGLAARLGYSIRQVERHLRAELGAGPSALRRAQRAQTARLLIETSTLAMTEVAMAAGFASVRAFNDAVREVFALSPTELRRRSTSASTPGALSLRLAFRQPLCPENLFGHLAAAAVPGVEEWRDGVYRRTLRLPHGHGIIALRPLPDHIGCQLRLSDLRDLSVAISRCRRLLDLDADPVAVDGALASDPVLAPLVREAPGRRVPRTVDAEELAICAVLGQQVSTAAACTRAARLVARHGEPVADPDGGLTHLFPTTAALAELDRTRLRLPRARGDALGGLVAALVAGRVDLGVGSDWQRVRADLSALPGLGPWTVETIAMRALGDPDAFLPTDPGIRRVATVLGLPATPAALSSRAGDWRPWRAYATQYLWAAGVHPTNRLAKRTVRKDTGMMTDQVQRAHWTIESPVGPLTLVATGDALCGLYMHEQRHRPADDSLGESDDAPFAPVLDELEEYFAGRRRHFAVPLALAGTPFQRRVWAALREIPYGRTVTYGRIAAEIGRPSASRAVGLAVGRNPIGIVVPCHRVVGSTGRLTGYAGGLDRKRHLLALEGSLCPARDQAADLFQA